MSSTSTHLPPNSSNVTFHRCDPLRMATFDEVGNAISIMHPLHFALRIEASSSQYVSPVREIVPSWHVLECVETLVVKGSNFSRLMMRLPCRGGDGGIVSVSGVSFLGQRTGDLFFLVFSLANMTVLSVAFPSRAENKIVYQGYSVSLV